MTTSRTAFNMDSGLRSAVNRKHQTGYSDMAVLADAAIMSVPTPTVSYPQHVLEYPNGGQAFFQGYSHVPTASGPPVYHMHNHSAGPSHNAVYSNLVRMPAVATVPVGATYYPISRDGRFPQIAYPHHVVHHIPGCHLQQLPPPSHPPPSQHQPTSSSAASEAHLSTTPCHYQGCPGYMSAHEAQEKHWHPHCVSASEQNLSQSAQRNHQAVSSDELTSAEDIVEDNHCVPQHADRSFGAKAYTKFIQQGPRTLERLPTAKGKETQAGSSEISGFTPTVTSAGRRTGHGPHSLSLVRRHSHSQGNGSREWETSTIDRRHSSITQRQPVSEAESSGNCDIISRFITTTQPPRKPRKPYTIRRSREVWTDEEHSKFVRALHLYRRNWKKIQSFVGSKTVLQIRSHAQKYFGKIIKYRTGEYIPPPRPKRKASNPYPRNLDNERLHTAASAVDLQPQSGWASESRVPLSNSVGEPSYRVMHESRSQTDSGNERGHEIISYRPRTHTIVSSRDFNQPHNHQPCREERNAETSMAVNDECSSVDDPPAHSAVVTQEAAPGWRSAAATRRAERMRIMRNRKASEPLPSQKRKRAPVVDGLDEVTKHGNLDGSSDVDMGVAGLSGSDRGATSDNGTGSEDNNENILESSYDLGDNHTFGEKEGGGDQSQDKMEDPASSGSRETSADISGSDIDSLDREVQQPRTHQAVLHSASNNR